MDNLYLHKKLILHTLITMLGNEDMVITPAVAIDIEKILLNTSEAELTRLSDLKYRLSPLICRDQEEQKTLYRIFDELDTKIPPTHIAETEPNTESVSEKERELSHITWWEKIKNKWAANKTPFITVFLVVIIGVAVGVAIYKNLIRSYKLDILTSPALVIVNDTVTFTAVLDSTVNKQEVTAWWKFSDNSTDTGFVVKKIVSDTSTITASVDIKDKNDQVIAKKNDTINALCEARPTVEIIEVDSVVAGKNGPTKVKVLAPRFTNGKPGEKGYTYNWYVDGNPISHKRQLAYDRPSYAIKLVVNCPGVHCSADSLVAPIYGSKPAIDITVTGTDRFSAPSPYTLVNILMSILFILSIPAIFAFPIYYLLSPKEETPADAEVVPPGMAEPYQIDLKDQLPNINNEDGIKKIADILRKRQTGDNFKLNISKTIYATVNAGGIPTLEFSPLSKPQSFLILIDKENADSHIVKLFGYLLDKLEQEQVEVYVYEYFKEPLFLSNNKLNHYRIPLEKVYTLYPDTTLIILGDAQYFIYPLKGVLKQWVTDKLSNWQTRILLSPHTHKDRDQKEKLISGAGFTVLSADLWSIAEIDSIVSNGTTITDITKKRADKTYRSRFLNFQELDNLKSYLADPDLLQWVCSLAVYPHMDWNFTIAVGKAIENDLKSKGRSVNLVNYTALLKIARISWMQNDVIDQSLRLEMLSWLDKDAMILARQTLYEQLEAISANIKEDSLVRSQFELNKTLNRFLLDINQGDKKSHVTYEAIDRIRRSSELDEAQNIYLNRDEFTVPDPRKKGEQVSLNKYLISERKKVATHPLIYSAIVFATLLISSMFYLFGWCNKTRSEVIFNIEKADTLIQSDIITQISYDSTFSNIRATQQVVSTRKADTVATTVIGNIDTSSFGFIRVISTDGSVLAQTKFKRNAKHYTVNIDLDNKPKLDILFNESRSFSWASVINQTLSSKFKVDMQGVIYGASDTSRIAFSESRRKDANRVASLIKGALNIDLPLVPESAGSRISKSDSALIVVVNPPKTAIQIPISALPTSLNEIWHGGSSNRLLTINLEKRALYYSVNDTKTYGTYTIDEVWLTPSGAFKIITRTLDQGYKLFFIRYADQGSTELSVCQNFVSNKADLKNKDESYCDKFNAMSYYYPKNDSLVYLPVSGGVLAASEQRKLKTMTDRARIKGVAASAKVTLNWTKYLPTVTQTGIDQILASSFDSITYVNKAIANSNPFQRDYLQIKPVVLPKKRLIYIHYGNSAWDSMVSSLQRCINNEGIFNVRVIYNKNTKRADTSSNDIRYFERGFADSIKLLQKCLQGNFPGVKFDPMYVNTPHPTTIAEIWIYRYFKPKSDDVVDQAELAKFKKSHPNSVFFEFDSSVLASSEYPKLDAMVATMKKDPTKQVTLNGYAPSTSTVAYAMRLGKDKANSVKTYLVAQGVAASSIKVKSFGSTQTKDLTGNTATRNRQNDRVDIVFDTDKSNGYKL